MAMASDSKATVSLRVATDSRADTVAMDASSRLTVATAATAVAEVEAEEAEASTMILDPLHPHLWIPSTQPQLTPPLRRNSHCSLEQWMARLPQWLQLLQLCNQRSQPSHRPSSIVAMAVTAEVDMGAGTSASEDREAVAMVADGESFYMTRVFVMCRPKEEERLTQCLSTAITCVNYASKHKSSSYISIAQLNVQDLFY